MDNNSRKTLSDEEVFAYVAADPALTTTKPWELVVESRKMKMWAWMAAAVVVAVHVFLAIIVAVGDSGTGITLIDQWGYFLVGLIFATVIYIALKRPRVRANSDGVDVRNFLGSQFYPWSVIYGLNFPEGARMARLELPEFEYVPLWAFQSADGIDSVKAVDKFRELEGKYMPED
ncbi:PH domain-containing protein [Corynebacterium vitaeruminis]|uniref:Low molecular weight protein antigen 6 PH domain-containing protein n=1 Tax=Corynebacterium vitaeruminis DSM 20294 TaxID=1224164 RepID=W5Y1T4_9CORY|nr:PH domain-containing protein [Corynebacterium vitaeruminis]AHI22874.1 hypothetical protein B843_07445 [Corynebacterium vitaeruminis DSM 20294]